MYDYFGSIALVEKNKDDKLRTRCIHLLGRLALARGSVSDLLLLSTIFLNNQIATHVDSKYPVGYDFHLFDRTLSFFFFSLFEFFVFPEKKNSHSISFIHFLFLYPFFSFSFVVLSDSVAQKY
jgi:hypothetical protein